MYVTGVLIATDLAHYVTHTFRYNRLYFVSAMVFDIPVRALHFGPDPTIRALTGALWCCAAAHHTRQFAIAWHFLKSKIEDMNSIRIQIDIQMW